MVFAFCFWVGERAPLGLLKKINRNIALVCFYSFQVRIGGQMRTQVVLGGVGIEKHTHPNHPDTPQHLM